MDECVRFSTRLMNRLPIVANHQNVVKPPEGEPALMTFDEVITMFHEFGHALHGNFSNVNYPYFQEHQFLEILLNTHRK